MSGHRHRTPRRFLVCRWTLLEVAATSPVSLVREYRDRLGSEPLFGCAALEGLHFPIKGGRGVVVTRPAQVPQALIAQAFALIAAHDRVEVVRLANQDEQPRSLLRFTGVPSRLGPEANVEQFPETRDSDEPLVAQYLGVQPCYIHRARGDHPWLGMSATAQVEDALLFESVEEATEWLAQHAPTERVVLRFAAAARADEDQRSAAVLAGEFVS